MAAAWIGVGVEKPSALMPASMRELNLNTVKPM
jgi:hypothetical protein